MKEIKKYLYYSPEVDVGYDIPYQFCIDTEKHEKIIGWKYLGEHLVRMGTYYYTGEY